MSEALDQHLTEPQRELYARTLTLARQTLLPISEAGTPGRVNRELVAALSQHGLTPRLFGGESGASAGADGDGEISAIELCLIREALARSCPEAETLFGVQGLGAYPILQAGTDAVRDRWIPRVAEGAAVASFALTEPQAGSDVQALALDVQRGDNGSYVLSGEKLWISNAPDADVYTVFARTSAGRGGISAFVVPGDAPGLSGEHKSLLAPHAIGSLVFDQVEIGSDHLLGREGDGLKVAMRTLDLFRPSVGAFAIGMARHALGLARDHMLARRTYGKPLAQHQAVAHRLAELTARTHAARLLVHQAAQAHDSGLRDPALAAMAKLMATETAQTAVDFAVQMHGAAGLEEGHPLEALYREVRAPRIYEGASEIQREIIARSLFREAGAQGGSG